MEYRMKFGKNWLVVMVIFVLCNCNTKAQAFDWAKSMSEGVTGEAISTDANGNSYVTGYFYGTAIFGSTQITSSGGADIFIAKYNSSGNLQWVQKAGGTGIDVGYSIYINQSGNCFVTGEFYGTAKFGTTQITSSGLRDVFIAKYDANGNFKWVQKAGGTYDDEGYGIFTDAAGNCFVTGEFYGTAKFGTTQITSNGSYDIFIAKYDANGTFKWVQKAGGTEVDYGKSISTDAVGNCYITGGFSSTSTFGTTQITSNGSYDIFIAKYDANGTFKWVQKAGGSNSDIGNGISTDAVGNCYITGEFSSTSTFGTTQITSNGEKDIFIAKYYAIGNFQWVKKAGGTGIDIGSGISTDAIGNSYVTGWFNNSATFGSTQITSNGNADIFIAKHDPNGYLQWVQKAGGTSSDKSNSISIDVEGKSYITGMNASNANFGNIVLNGGGFISRLGTPRLTITSPIGGEVWQSNSAHNITWNTNSPEDSIKIDFTTNNGTDWTTLQNNIQARYGNHTFIVHSNVNSIGCKIKLSSLSYGIVSTSGQFSITSSNVPNLTITSPNTGVKWNAGSTKNITWTRTVSIDNVKLEYTTDNGNNWITITASTPASSGTYNWTIPNTLSTRCRVRISDVSNSLVNDVSDELFTIIYINITAPISGEKWKAQTVKNIKWNSVGVTALNLYYTTTNGIDWNLIDSNIPANNSTYNWNIPDTESTECRIKLEDASESSLILIGDKFTIWKPEISIQTPAIGQTTQSFGLTNISLTAYIFESAPITIIYYPYEAPENGYLPYGVYTINPFYWTIEAPGLLYTNGTISIPINKLINVHDPTKVVWLKRDNPGGNWTNIGGVINNMTLKSTQYFDTAMEFAIGNKDGVADLTQEKKVEKNYSLLQNYPNPFNPSTVIKYQLPKSEFVTLKVYDILGKEVASLVNREQSAGSYDVTFEASQLAAGLYVYQLRAGEFISTKKLMFVK